MIKVSKTVNLDQRFSVEVGLVSYDEAEKGNEDTENMIVED